jgi:hypothetical protein
MWRRTPLITGKDEMDQLTKIFKLLGTPIEKELEEFQDCPLVKNGVIKGFGKIMPIFSEIFSSGSYVYCSVCLGNSSYAPSTTTL